MTTPPLSSPSRPSAHRATPDRQIERRARRMDALRLVPVLGALIFLFPLLFTGAAGWSTALVGLYLFAGWAVLIGLIAILSRQGGPVPEDTDDRGSDPDMRR